MNVNKLVKHSANGQYSPARTTTKKANCNKTIFLCHKNIAQVTGHEREK